MDWQEWKKSQKSVETEEFPNEIILKVRAGAGGEEAALFAKKLALMYILYAGLKNWSAKVLYASESSLGGYKEAAIEMRGEGAYEKLRFETGVHRIQRIPETEKMGRVHTSTASVAILPIRKKTKIEIVLCWGGTYPLKELLESRGFVIEKIIRTQIGPFSIEKIPRGGFKVLKESQMKDIEFRKLLVWQKRYNLLPR